MGCSVNDTVVVGSTGEFCAPYSRNALGGVGLRQLVLPIGMTISRLFVRHSGDQAVSEQSVTVTLDTVNTSLSLSIPTSSDSFTSNTTDSFHANAGQEISLHFISPVGSTASVIRNFTLLGVLDG